MLLILCMMSTACSDNANTAQSTAVDSTMTNSVESTTPSSSENMHFSSLQDYIDYLFSETDEEDFSNEVMTYRVYADQETLIYDYTYNKQYDDITGIKEKLDESYDLNIEAVQYMLSELRNNVAVENPKIKYIYRNNDGTVITEHIYE